jgi:hypothetical protein
MTLYVQASAFTRRTGIADKQAMTTILVFADEKKKNLKAWMIGG